MSTAAVLRVEGLHAGYGDMAVVLDVHLRVEPGRTAVLVGRNGAGKTTTLMTVAGIRAAPPRGAVRLGDVDLTTATPSQIVEAGVALVPADHRVFASMSVLENLRMGMFPWRRSRRDQMGSRIEHVYELFPILAQFAHRPAGQLSGGQQQMVAIGQALMADPRVLLLDEPSSGLSPAAVEVIYDALAALRTDGRGILLVEQSLDRAFGHSDHGYVMDQGRIALSGPSAELAADPRVGDIVRGASPG